MGKIGIDEIHNQAKHLFMEEKMEAANELAIEISKVLVDKQTALCVLALGIVQAGIFSEVEIADPKAEIMLKALFQRITNHYQEIYVDYLKSKMEGGE